MSSLAGTADAHGNRVVRAQGEARAAVADAVTDVAKALNAGRSNTTSDGTTKAAPSTVVKNLGDAVRKVVKDVRKAGKKSRDGATDTAAGDDG